ncbi:MAG: hypothetical protein OEZ23_05440, partial [Gammaproteobacteria bacterium]|nr:hypothetical protein [Gammaproteobacteria bacterium]
VLVNRLIEPADLICETRRYATELIATVSPESLKQTRRQIYEDLHSDIGTSVRKSETLIREMMQAENYRRAIKAFTDKRLPDWSYDGD